jgi:hypothetical protein
MNENVSNHFVTFHKPHLHKYQNSHKIYEIDMLTSELEWNLIIIYPVINFA